MNGRILRLSSLAFAVLLVILAAPSGSSQDRQVVKITAERFTFTPSQIKVKRGTVIELRLRSDDTIATRCPRSRCAWMSARASG